MENNGLNNVIPTGEQSLKRNEPLENEKNKAEPEKKRTAELESIEQSGEREKKWIAEREKYQAVERNGPLNVRIIKHNQKRKGLLKGNCIGRVLNLAAWRRECDTGKLYIHCNAIERVLPIKSSKGMSYTPVATVPTVTIDIMLDVALR